MVDFHENLSINGLLLQPQVGAHWYTARPGFFDKLNDKVRSSPAFAIGMSARLEQPTFCLSGETPEVSIDAVNSVKATIEAIQAKTVEATTITVDLAAARAALQKNATDKLLAAADAATKKAELEKRVADLTEKKTDVDKAIADLLKDYREAFTKHPGLIVARWTVRNAAGASAKTGIFDVSGSKSDTTSGYLILGGLRVSSLYFGDDLRSYVRIVEKVDAKLFDQFGITTYLIQTRALAYTNALDLQKALSASLSASIKSLGSIEDLLTAMDKITLSGYITTAMNLDNTGSMNNATWYVRPRPMVEYDDNIPQETQNALDAKIGRNRTDDEVWARVRPMETFNLESIPAAKRKQDPTTRALQDYRWYTVVAVSADAPKVYAAFRAVSKDKALPRFENIDERSYMLVKKTSLEERKKVIDEWNQPATSQPLARK
jgi:hypothetical protein